MRKQERRKYEDALRQVFHTYVIRTRSNESLTQAEMAEGLEMDERSFAYLDYGQSCCSALTLALYLSYYCEDPLQFLEDFRVLYEKEAKLLL